MKSLQVSQVLEVLIQAAILAIFEVRFHTKKNPVAKHKIAWQQDFNIILMMRLF